jgi:hypothetical protein
MVTIGWLGPAPHIGETYKHIYVTLLCLTLLFLSYTCSRPLNRFVRTISQTTLIDPRKSFLGLFDDKLYSGDYPFPKIFKEHFVCKSKKSNYF